MPCKCERCAGAATHARTAVVGVSLAEHTLEGMQQTSNMFFPLPIQSGTTLPALIDLLATHVKGASPPHCRMSRLVFDSIEADGVELLPANVEAYATFLATPQHARNIQAARPDIAAKAHYYT
jgi:hypothetical protein